MRNEKLRKEAEAIMTNMEKEQERLKELSYQIWISENGEKLSNSPVESFGYKAVLRALGYRY